jgi:exopolysaccharide production protein ExoZ
MVRIYPILFIYSFLYLCFYQIFSVDKNLSFEQIIGSLLLVPGYSSLIIGPGWTLSYEIYFYICFSIAMALGLVRGILALTCFFLISITAQFILDQNQPIIHVLTSTLLVEFLFGAWIGFAVVAEVRVGNAIANLMLVFAFAGFLAGILFGFTGVVHAHLPSAVTWGIPSALLVASLVFRERNGHVTSSIKNLSFFGDSSYSLYLLHIVLIDAVILAVFRFDNSANVHAVYLGSLGMMTVCILITFYCVATAFASYELIERRVVGFLQKIVRQKTSVSAKPQVS